MRREAHIAAPVCAGGEEEQQLALAVARAWAVQRRPRCTKRNERRGQGGARVARGGAQSGAPHLEQQVLLGVCEAGGPAPLQGLQEKLGRGQGYHAFAARRRRTELARKSGTTREAHRAGEHYDGRSQGGTHAE